MLALAPASAHADHSGYAVAHEIGGFSRKPGLPSYSVPDNLHTGGHGHTGGDGYRYSWKGRTDYADYWIGNMNEGRYSISIRIPSQGSWIERPATRHPTATRVRYEVWQKRLVDENGNPDQRNGTPTGDWYVKDSFNIDQLKAWDNGWLWTCYCSERYELFGPTVIRVDFNDSSTGRITLDAINVRHRSFTQRQVDLAEAAGAEFDRSDCRGWLEETLGVVLAIAGALITGFLTGGAAWAVAIGAAVWAIYDTVLQDQIRKLTKHYIDHHVCS